MHGRGRFTDYFGSTYYGDWEQNQKGSLDIKNPGKGISIELNGDKEPCDKNNGTYEGEMRRGLKHGKGKFTYDDGTIFEGLW